MSVILPMMVVLVLGCAFCAWFGCRMADWIDRE